MFQGSKFAENLNADPFPFNPQEVDALILTHAHIDHTGRTAKLVKEGFFGKIYATHPTLDFTKVLLEDAEHILREEMEREGVKPFFDIEDIKNAFKLSFPVYYHKEIVISDEMRFVLKNAGHILGSAIVELYVKTSPKSEIKIVFSGDLGNYPAPIIGKTEFIQDADYVLVESAYGNRRHETKKERKDLLEDIIENTVNKKGTLIIPAFAVERTQELLYELGELFEQGRVQKVPVYLDSPLAIKITNLYKEHIDYFDDKTQKRVKEKGDIFDFPELTFVDDVNFSKKIDKLNEPKIIIAGSGMSDGGRIMYHEKAFLSDPKNTLLIIGYQVPGSVGRKLLEGAKEVKICGEYVNVRAEVKSIDGYSAHADTDQLLEWVDPMRHTAKRVFVVQGEEDAAEYLAQQIKDRLAVDADTPTLNSEVKLD